jgi:trimethylamine:corrinoid methyltransferase-like protein
MRPKIKLLSDNLVEKILDEALTILEEIGVMVENREGIKLLEDSGARIDKASQRAFIPRNLVEESLKLAPSEIKVFDRKGEKSFLV